MEPASTGVLSCWRASGAPTTTTTVTLSCSGNPVAAPRGLRNTNKHKNMKRRFEFFARLPSPGRDDVTTPTPSAPPTLLLDSTRARCGAASRDVSLDGGG